MGSCSAHSATAAIRAPRRRYAHRRWGEDGFRDLLQTLDPKARDDLRHVLIRDQADRDAISSRLMRFRDQNGQDWADVIDFLTMHPDARRPVARVLAEIAAGDMPQ